MAGALIFAMLGCFAGLQLPLRYSALGLPVVLLLYALGLAVAGHRLGHILVAAIIALVAAQVGMFVAVLVRLVGEHKARARHAGQEDRGALPSGKAGAVFERIVR